MASVAVQSSLDKLQAARAKFRSAVNKVNVPMGTWDITPLTSCDCQSTYKFVVNSAPVCYKLNPRKTHIISITNGIWVLRNCSVSYTLSPGDVQNVESGLDWVLETVDPAGEYRGTEISDSKSEGDCNCQDHCSCSQQHEVPTSNDIPAAPEGT